MSVNVRKNLHNPIPTKNIIKRESSKIFISKNVANIRNRKTSDNISTENNENINKLNASKKDSRSLNKKLTYKQTELCENKEGQKEFDLSTKFTKLSFNQNESTKESSLNAESISMDCDEKIKTSEEQSSCLNIMNLTINRKSHKPDFKLEEYRKMGTLIERELHGIEILDTLHLEEKVVLQTLHRHKVTERMRMRMVDWMIEVINNYKCDQSVFFQAVNLMDSFFDMTKRSVEPSELHLIGVTCMFIASKYNDIYPLRLKTMQDKIAHKKLSEKEIKDKESEIMHLRSYKLGDVTAWDFLSIYLEEMFSTNENNYFIKSKFLINEFKSAFTNNITLFKLENHSEESKCKTKITANLIKLIQHVSIYLAKMNLHDYQLIDKKPSLIAASTIFVSLKICEQINKEEYLNESFIKKLIELSRKSESEIIKCAQKILHNAQNFESIFPGLENLKKIHFNAIIELKQTK